VLPQELERKRDVLQQEDSYFTQKARTKKLVPDQVSKSSSNAIQVMKTQEMDLEKIVRKHRIKTDNFILFNTNDILAAHETPTARVNFNTTQDVKYKRKYELCLTSERKLKRGAFINTNDTIGDHKDTCKHYLYKVDKRRDHLFTKKKSVE
jgi:hypothetical protein